MQKKTSLGFSTAIDLDLGPTVDRGDTHRSLASASCVEENSFGSVYWGVYSRCVYVHIYIYELHCLKLCQTNKIQEFKGPNTMEKIKEVGHKTSHWKVTVS